MEELVNDLKDLTIRIEEIEDELEFLYDENPNSEDIEHFEEVLRELNEQKERLEEFD